VKHPPRFKDAFIGYHLVLALAVVVAYGVAQRVTAGTYLLSAVSEQTRPMLYISLAGTCGVLLGFALTAITVFTGLGSGRGMDFLRGTPGFAYTRKVFMGAISAYAVGTVVMTALIVADSAKEPKKWIEALAVGVLALVGLRTWALLWLLNKLLDQVLEDARTRFAKKTERLAKRAA
jgi:hypothetical protein